VVAVVLSGNREKPKKEDARSLSQILWKFLPAASMVRPLR